MADEGAEKTEQPSEKRRQEYRQRGEIPRSRDIVSVLVLFCALFYFAALGRGLVTGLSEVMTFYLDLRRAGELTVPALQALGWELVGRMALLVGPLVGMIIGVGLLANIAQVGVLFTTKPLELDFNKLNPLPRFVSTFFSKHSLGQLVGSVAKISLVGVVVWGTLQGERSRIRSLAGVPLAAGTAYMIDRALDVVMNVALTLIIIAIADYAWNRWSLEQKMKMTKQEVKDEAKEHEGNPHVKGKIGRRAREIANQRMMQAVPLADVVVNNPTHLSIALRYRQGVDAAPVVVAKGADELALRIRSVARASEVPMVTNVQLARVLYKHVKVGKPVPSQFYRAVAEVLAYVYRLRRAQPWMERRRQQRVAEETERRRARAAGEEP
jgi:flagellar biosynthetic protein FlhB